MSSDMELEARIRELMRIADAGFAARRRAREELMERISAKKERFEPLATGLLERVVRPRLDVLVRSFAHSGSLAVMDGGHGVAVAFSYTEEFPAHARVEVSIAHDPDYDRAWCAFSASILPILMEYERDTSQDVSIESPDEPRLARFVDQRIETFVASYLSICQPDSFYQKSLLVTDPVCGMTFRRADAQSVLERDGKRVFFCADVCRQQFEASPHPDAAGSMVTK